MEVPAAALPRDATPKDPAVAARGTDHRWSRGTWRREGGRWQEGAGLGALVEMVDATCARAAMVRPLLAHARIAVRRQVGACELARVAPPDTAAHTIRTELLVLQVIKPL